MLVSACLIVKDEEHNLPSCLGALNGIADEVVIYDTGSSDGTIALAEDSGATVVRGYWDDDFGRARAARFIAARMRNRTPKETARRPRISKAWGGLTILTSRP